VLHQFMWEISNDVQLVLTFGIMPIVTWNTLSDCNMIRHYTNNQS
jgi:hypothetical protein